MSIKRRSECNCICHQPGVVAKHVIPCCSPDMVEPNDAISNLKEMIGWLRDQIGPRNADKMIELLEKIEGD